MNLFEQLKLMPKVDMHINLVSSISTCLASYLKNEHDILDMEELMLEKNYKDYEKYNSCYDCMVALICTHVGTRSQL